MANTELGSDLVLQPATPDQVLVTWQRHRVEWGKGLTPEQYLDRERLLATREFTSDNLTVYVLVPRADPTTLEPLAHCDVFRRPGARIAAGSTVTVTEGDVYSIASVFCPPSTRGQGYASTMMSQLYQILRSKPGCIGSNLYSDVGPTFYARKGWQTYASRTVVVPVAADGPAVAASIERLDRAAALALSEADCQRFKQALFAMAARLEPGSATALPASYFAIFPTAASYDWHWARATFLAAIYNQAPPTIFGVRLSNPKPINATELTATDSYVLWFHDMVKEELIALRTHVAHRADSPALVAAMLAEARRYGFKRIAFWQLHEPALSPFRDHVLAVDQLDPRWGAHVVEREDSLPGLADFGAQEAEAPCEWLCDDRYAWV
ncbi:hypothetical protein IWQ60_010202 [Tieghemiomyces parasiticus]|uniref:N-acetyltransferase domain-containing protein n=1 Tax=Tieghemiomyces parasiticus TaxID=78921 RepID=A0A9W7ZR03_9FUNG|nr:hypothetical protein IWQ60_010202 [Tieghemiomyces parasiticus]